MDIVGVKNPDEENRTSADIDWLLIGANRKIAVEHTSIETFPNYRRGVAHFHNHLRYFGSIDFLDALCGRIGRGVDIELFYPPYVDVARRNVRGLMGSLQKWILETAPDLSVPGVFPTRATTIKHRDSRYWVKLSVRRVPGGTGTRFTVIPIYLGNEQRDSRGVVERAFAAKAFKLGLYKGAGAGTLLVLEQHQAFASPCIPIFYAAQLLTECYSDKVDAVACVNIEGDMCEILVARPGETDRRQILENNWWRYSIRGKSIVQRNWQ